LNCGLFGSREYVVERLKVGSDVNLILKLFDLLQLVSICDI